MSARLPSVDRFRDEFEVDDRSVWLDTAHQGRLPRRAAEALEEAVGWKLHPEEIASSQRFSEVPARVRRALAELLSAEPEDVVLANSASYGLHLIANGLQLEPGDEILVPANDFPSDILPWLLLRDRGVAVRMIEPADEVLTAEELEAALSPRTRVVCLTWVHSFSGRVVDLGRLGGVCRERGVWFIVNGSQGVGALPIRVADVPIDAMVGVGWKWLCGPYGTGLCWLRPELRDALRPGKLYWLSVLSVEDLAAPSLDLESISPPRAGGLDVFAPASFFNQVPFAAALELMLELGIEEVSAHVDGLVRRLLGGVDRSRYRLVSSDETRSSLVLVEPLEEPIDRVLDRLATAGMHVAHRRGRIRISPHLYNASREIDRVLDVL